MLQLLQWLGLKGPWSLGRSLLGFKYFLPTYPVVHVGNRTPHQWLRVLYLQDRAVDRHAVGEQE